MPFTIHKEEKGTRYVKLAKTVHLTADGRPVDELDTEGKTLLGIEGSLITEDEAKKYNLDESHVVSDEPFKPAKAGQKAEPEPIKEPEPEAKKTAAEKKADKKAENATE